MCAEHCRAKKRLGSRCKTARSLVALQDANCTTVRGELDLGEAAADSAEKALGEPGGTVFEAMGIGLEKGFGAIIHAAGGGLRVEIERIVAGEAHLDESPAALHGVEAGADKVAINQNISRGG